MIFKQLISQLRGAVADAVKQLFDAAFANQTHPQDLLLVDRHGSYDEALATYTPPPGQPRPAPYVVGPHLIGLAEDTFYKFTDGYRKSHLKDKAEFDRAVGTDPGLQEQEELLLQIEQSVYLRFWESDLILKRLHQLSSLSVGKPYDWLLRMPRKTGRHKTIREGIRDRVKNVCPAFYALVKENYKSQIRNAIAHSQYYIAGRRIEFLNYSEDPKDYAPLRGMSFDEWYSMFHTTLLLHSEMIGAFKRYRARYKEETLAKGNRIQIRIVLRTGCQEFRDLALRPGRDVWDYAPNL